MKKIRNFLTQKQSFYGLVVIVGILALGAFTTVDQIRTKQLEEQMEKVELAESNNVAEEHKAPTIVESTEQKLPDNAKESQGTVVGEGAISVEQQEESTPKQEETTTEVTKAVYDGKTKLQWPLSGNVVLPYSMDSTIYFQTLDQYQCNPGMMIQAAEGADVKNIAQGTVIDVKKTTKYGMTVTIDIGNQYFITYGQLKDVNWKKGDVLEKDAVIGRVAPVTEFFTLEGNHLYFEMKQGKKPINPMKHLA